MNQIKRMKKLDLILVLITLILIACNRIQETPNNANLNSKEKFLVTKIIDGDTFQIQDGRKVRLIGIDTSELKETYYKEAKNQLEFLIMNKTIVLEKDVSETDRYGRILRYVYLEDGTFINYLLVEQGFAQASEYRPDIKYSSLFEEAEIKAEISGFGIWRKSKTSDFTKEFMQEGISLCTDFGCPSGTIAVGSKKSDKWHPCNCKYASQIEKENLICFNSIEEAESLGYIQTKVC